ncbi:MAG: hypothetical protein WB564_04495 [Dehalococcoidia bacterium]
MKYKYIAAYELSVLSHIPDTGDVEIYADEDGFSVRAILTQRVDEYCYELDRAQSFRELLLKGLAGQGVSNDLRAEVEVGVNRIRERRNKALGRSEVLVFTAEGEVEPDFSRRSAETDDFVYAFGVINKEDIAILHSAQINAVLAAFCLSIEHETIQVKPIQRGIYLLNESGKPVYSFDFSISAGGFVSKRTTDEVIREVQSQVVALTGEKSLATVNRLLVQAISSENEKLHRFIFGWAALDIFVNKAFREYKKTLPIPTPARSDSAGCRQKKGLKLDERIHRAMRGSNNINIADKFAVIVKCLGDDSAETDLKTFTSIRDERDKLYHEGAFDEDSLPIAEAIKLLKKYLRLHISKKAT